MGACCGGYTIPEIEEASTLKELSNCLREKNNEIPVEQKEIEDYLKDNKKVPKKVTVQVKKFI